MPRVYFFAGCNQKHQKFSCYRILVNVWQVWWRHAYLFLDTQWHPLPKSYKINWRLSSGRFNRPKNSKNWPYAVFTLSLCLSHRGLGYPFPDSSRYLTSLSGFRLIFWLNVMAKIMTHQIKIQRNCSVFRKLAAVASCHYSFYSRKQLLLSARISHRNSVRPSVCLSVCLCKLESPNLHRRLPGRL